ncbi:hypothetical protein BLA39750_07697 [Burkholderia lata]|uniref:Uncharacterized protein n=1 Tax=Burkholderia lata (strain ATCC 17760 / DSM 23089 / LMG 22485 / NCIMB 9086 / R18194 / 383) TaxID=482957 RepID=A0A6P3C500_BURL3|nr:hypothetical protein [Burkholderia lata]VWD63275.1 hypothetical protein BLA39750_07697 [Burkholderia lata]
MHCPMTSRAGDIFGGQNQESGLVSCRIASIGRARAEQRGDMAWNGSAHAIRGRAICRSPGVTGRFRSQSDNARVNLRETFPQALSTREIR